MLLQTVRKYCDLGLRTTARVIAHKLARRRAHKKMRAMVSHNWTMIAARHSVTFAEFWREFGKRKKLG